jgi:hypothetical protein
VRKEDPSFNLFITAYSLFGQQHIAIAHYVISDKQIMPIAETAVSANYHRLQ